MQIEIMDLMPIFYIAMMFFMWLFPPRWVKSLIDESASWFESLKQWGPRLVGAVRWDNVEEVKGQAQKDSNPLIQTLMMVGELAPLIEKLPTIIHAIESTGLLGEGSLAAPAKEATKAAGGAW